MKELKRRFALRTALLITAVVALLASAAVFMAVNAENDENVFSTDVSGSDGTSLFVSQYDVSPFGTNEAPENLGEPVVTMTTGYAVGTKIYLDLKGQNIFVDYGDGNPVEYPGDKTVRGSTIKLYGNITSFLCHSGLTSLDVSNCTALTYLDCYCNQLTSLDVSGCTALTYLDCCFNQLTSLDVSHNTELKFLRCDCNQLTTLDVSHNTALTDLICDNTQLISLDVSGCTALTNLDCRQNELLSLDVSNNTALKFLQCDYNQLTTLDMSHNTALTELWCTGNQLTTLDVSGCTALTYLTCGENQLTVLDVLNNTDLTFLECHCNQLIALDVSRSTDLWELRCGSNQLTILDVSHNTNLIELSCLNNQLTSLDVSNNTALMYLDCDNNQLSSLDVSHNTALEGFGCADNKLTSLDVSNNTAMKYLACEVNQLTSLDVSYNTFLEVLDCYDNQLTSLDVSGCTVLRYLDCSDNQLTMTQIDSFTKTIQTVKYAPQTHVIPSAVKVGESIDLSSVYSVDGTMSAFTWYDGDGNNVTPSTANGGVFTFGEDAVEKKLVCKMTNAKLPDFEADADSGYYDDVADEWIPTKVDNRLTTTEVTVEAAGTEDPTNPTGDDENHSAYYDLEVIPENDLIEIDEAGYGEDVTVSIDGRIEELRKVKGVHLTVGNIEKNKKKSVLEAIAHYKETFNADTNNIALYDIDLADGTHTHIKVVNGCIAIRIKYPDNLARQSEDYTFHLYHQKDDGTVEEIPLIVKPNGLWFYATDFSPYVLTWEEKAEPSANTGESALVIWVMAGLFALSLAGAGVVLYRRRKLTAE